MPTVPSICEKLLNEDVKNFVKWPEHLKAVSAWYVDMINVNEHLVSITLIQRKKSLISHQEESLDLGKKLKRKLKNVCLYVQIVIWKYMTALRSFHKKLWSKTRWIRGNPFRAIPSQAFSLWLIEGVETILYGVVYLNRDLRSPSVLNLTWERIWYSPCH